MVERRCLPLALLAVVRHVRAAMSMAPADVLRAA